MILALRQTGLWIFSLDDFYYPASALPELCTATVYVLPSPEHENRYFRRSIKYEHRLVKHEIRQAAYPAIIDLGKVLFGEKEVTHEEVGWEKTTFTLKLTTEGGTQRP